MLNFILLQAAQNLAEGAEAVAAGQDGIFTKFFNMAVKGGWIMIPILVLSLIAAFIFFDRYFAVKKAGKVDSDLMKKVSSLKGSHLLLVIPKGAVIFNNAINLKL